MKVTIPPVLITFALVCIGLFPKVNAVVPPPDGGYPNFTTAEGSNALFSLTTGSANTAVGWFSLFSNTEGSFNTAAGAGALLFNTSDQNTAFGAAALLFNTIGFANTAVGVNALVNTGAAPIDIGDGGPASINTAVGASALMSNTMGAFNTAIGGYSLFHNTIGIFNTGIGVNSLSDNTSGQGNIALGSGAGSSLTTGDDNIDIGNFGVAGEFGTIRMGSEFQTRTFIAAIRGVTTGIADAVNVVIDSNGQLGTMSSSRRFKKEIGPMDNASESIHALKPVTFRYKSDKGDTPQFGLIAEEVAKVNPDLVVRDKNGEIYTVRYDAVNAMLLNEFLKEHRKVNEQQATIAQLKSTVAQQQTDFLIITARQQTQIEALTQGLQKVSEQIQMSRPAPQVVNNP